jgi:hypothetical protein
MAGSSTSFILGRMIRTFAKAIGEETDPAFFAAQSTKFTAAVAV